MLFNFDLDGGPISERMISYTGSYLWYQDEATGHWELALLTSGTLRFLTAPGDIDICAVGPGEDGQSGSCASESDCTGGDGGFGGEMVTVQRRALRGTAYLITIGTPGNATACDALDVSAQSGSHSGDNGTQPGHGSRVAWPAGIRTYPAAGDNGTLAYNGEDTQIPDLAGTLFGARGGGARATCRYSGQYYNNNGSGSTSGGQTGAGSGGSADSKGDDASPNTGSGGGGGGAYAGAAYAGGSGGTGIMFIRDHREVAA